MKKLVLDQLRGNVAFVLLLQAADSSFLDLLSIPDNENKANLNNS